MKASETSFVTYTILGQTHYWKTNKRYYRKSERGRTQRVREEEYERAKWRLEQKRGGRQ